MPPVGEAVLLRELLSPSLSGGMPLISEGEFGLDQGMILLMIENFRSGLLWRWTRNIPCVRAGLKRCSLSGGWPPGCGWAVSLLQ